MNKDRKEELWSAYLDGELSCSEAREYDKTLTEEERARFSAEMRFEEALAGRLCDNLRCPDELWKRVTRRLAEETSPRRPLLRIPWRTAAMAATAAILVAVFVRTTWFPPAPLPAPDSVAATAAPVTEDFLVLVPAVDALASLAQIGGDEASVTAFMRSRGFPFRLEHVSALAETTVARHPVKLVGARERIVKGAHVLEIMWVCCGHAVIVELAEEGTQAARMIHTAADSGSIQDVRQFGRHVAALVSVHKVKPFLNLVRPELPDFSRAIGQSSLKI